VESVGGHLGEEGGGDSHAEKPVSQALRAFYFQDLKEKER
jgi:hypothetical protein